MCVPKYAHGFFPVLLAIATVLAAARPASCEEGDAVAYQVKVIQRNGSVFDAVMIDEPVVRFFRENKSLDLKALNSSEWLTLYYMRGLNGYMKIQVERLESVTRLLPLSENQLGEMKDTILRRINILRQKEKARLARLKKERAERRKKEAEAEAAAREEKKERAEVRKEDEAVQWILRFPPDDGWGPEKKDALYKRSIALGVYPNKEEQAFLDHYSEWLAQFPVWVKRQEEAAAAEAAAKEGKEEGGKEGREEGKGKTQSAEEGRKGEGAGEEEKASSREKKVEGS